MTRATRHQTAVIWALAGLIVTAPHLLGGIFAWGTLSLAAAATSLAGFSAWAWHAPSEGRRIEPVAIVLGALVAITALQALPLPTSIADVIAPDAVENASAVHGLLGMVPPRAVAMTLDPGRTHERVVFAVAVWATFCTALVVSTRRRSLVFAAVGVSGVLIAISDLIHVAFDASTVYGLYRPIYTPARGPILNPNNLAGMLAMCTPVCLGLAARSADKRVYWGAGAVVTGTSCLVANSRAGTAALFVGVTLFAVMTWLGPAGAGESRGGHKSSSVLRRVGVAVIPLGALVTMFVVAKFAADTPLDTNYENLSKLDLLMQEAEFVRHAGVRALIGIGRGALPAVFSAARFPSGRVFHAENFALQYIMDVGLPAALLMLGVVTVRVLRTLVRWHSVAQLGALCGCIAIGFQNLIDFSLELTGIAVPVSACLAATLATRKAEHEQGHGAASLAWASAAVGAIAVTVFGASALRHDAYVSQVRLQQLIQARSGDDFWPAYRESLLSHPADPGLAMLGAARKVREQKIDAGPWIARTLVLAPSWSAPHVLAAQWELGQGRQSRAVAALRSAAERDPKLALYTLCDWLKRAPYGEVVFMVVPDAEPQRLTVLDRGASCLEGAPEEASKVDQVLLKEHPQHLGASLRMLRRRLVRGDYIAAAAEAHALRQHYPTEAEPYRLEARALLAQRLPQKAVEVLRAGVDRVENRHALLLELVDALARAGDDAGMRQTVEHMRESWAGDTRQIAQAMAALSRGESSLNNHARALRAARDAYALEPEGTYLALAARAAERMGQPSIALESWNQACRESPQNPAFCRSRDELVKRMQQAPSREVMP